MNKPVWESLQEVFDRAVAIARERNQARGYGDSWRSGRTGVRGLVAMCDHKTTRLTNQLFNTPEEEWPLEEALDSALDNVNYSAFVAILLMERIESRDARRAVDEAMARPHQADEEAQSRRSLVRRCCVLRWTSPGH